MSKVNIFGKGGHAKVIRSIIENNIADDLGAIMDDKDYLKIDTGHWVIGIGDNTVRKERAQGILKNESFYTLISKSCLLPKDYNIGKGSLIFHGAIIQVNTKIGNHCIINTNANVDHDCIIEDFVHIAPGCTLCGDVFIGEGTFIGAGTTIIPGITIGKNCIIGAGSTVVKDIPDNTKAFGNPCTFKESL